MKHKVSELEGALLDAAVAKAEGFGEMDGLKVYSDTCWLAETNEHDQFVQDVRYQPSTDWSLGGPIIEREQIGVEWDHYNCFGGGWTSVLEHAARPDGVQRSFGRGPTPLIAAMRAYVAFKLGKEIELP